MTTFHFQTHVSDSGVITLPLLPETFYGENVTVKVDVNNQPLENDGQSDSAEFLPNGKMAVEDCLAFCQELNLPPLTEERRKELVKVAGKYAEEAKISMRNIRQDSMGKIKRAKDDKEISEDDQRRFEEDLQKVFETRASEVDALARQKEQDIMSV